MGIHVIADLGINHNGSMSYAREMIRAAHQAGVWAIKFQKRDIDWCYTKDDLSKQYISPWGTTVDQKVRGRELSWSNMETLSEYCDSLGMKWGCSCFDMKSLIELEKNFGPRLAFHKIPSAMAVIGRVRFMNQVARFKKLTLISTGLIHSYDEMDAIAGIFESFKCPYVLNHCVAIYPCPHERLNLRNIQSMILRFMDSGKYPHCRGIGYSGHEVGELPAVIAAQLGAIYIERHLTLDRSMYGADQSASLEPQGLQRLVRDINNLPKMLGYSERILIGDEKNPVSYFKDEDPNESN